MFFSSSQLTFDQKENFKIVLKSLMQYVLGFDLSSTTVGYTICKKDTEEIKKIGYYSFPDKITDLLDKGQFLENFITDLLKEFPEITEFVIEERLKKFAGNRASIDGILKLAQLNYICQYLMKNKFNLSVVEINVLKARKLVFPNIFKITRQTKQNQKEFVFNSVLPLLGEDIFPKKIPKSGKFKGQEVFLEEAKDMADSWVICKAYFLSR